ncbi:hypothetical protein TNCV_910401 [Trichonephila clavipes]|uniref:Uncharacterized protein n=1 Tax=Trichonephila clavipes TaxID=2585209 RepID=A0A8X7BEE4_TRICX|nr:hypothetical protein TNCV_910401 [Trichonephila clavipes]
MSVSMNIIEIDRRLVPLNRACDILDEFIKEEALKRKSDSAKDTTEHTKKVNECVMELFYRIKKEIEMKELYMTHTIYKKMIEIIERTQQIKKPISILHIWIEKYATELQWRELRIEEVKKMYADIFCLRKKPEKLMQLLQQEQREPVICLQGNKFEFIRWLKQELARCTQRLQEGQNESPQQLLQELKCNLQTLYQSFVDITRQVELKNAKRSLLFTFASSALVEGQAEIAQLGQLYTEITHLLQQEQKESLLNLQPWHAGLPTYLPQGQEVQQDVVVPWIRFQQTQSEPARPLHQSGGAPILRQNQAGLGICLTQEQFKQARYLHQAGGALMFRQNQESLLNLQPWHAGLPTYLPQEQEVQQDLVVPWIRFQQTQSELARHLHQSGGAPILRQNQAGLGICLTQEQFKQARCLHQAGGALMFRQNQVLQAIHLNQKHLVPVICLQQEQAVPTMRSQQVEERVVVGVQQKGGPTTHLLQEDVGQPMSLQLIEADPTKHLQQKQARPIVNLQQKQSGEEICSQKEQLGEEVLLHQDQLGEEVRLQKEQSGQDVQLEQEQADCAKLLLEQDLTGSTQ